MLDGLVEEVAMSVFRTLSAVGAALAGTVAGTGAAAPPADPRDVRAMLVDVGLVRPEASDGDVEFALRRFQSHVGLVPDGVAGPRTVQVLARYAREARDMRALGFAA
jgi:murein L,D-transpeptidase YcbB/YkuD